MKVVFILKGTKLWKHKRLETFQLTLEGYVRTFCCGRKVTEVYEEAVADRRFDMVKCKQCFNSPLLNSNDAG